jgi:hypothetical protein
MGEPNQRADRDDYECGQYCVHGDDRRRCHGHTVPPADEKIVREA